jgi:hypothetical protein
LELKAPVGTMRPVVLIIEARREVAEALAEVVHSASYSAMIRPYIAELSDLDVTPSAIIVRIAFEGVGEPSHDAIGRLPHGHPPVIAIAWEDRELAEARRLKCDVVLRAPDEVSLLGKALTDAVNTSSAML